MKTAGNSGEPAGRVTQKQIVCLGASISADNMESIGEGYMDIDDVTIKNIRRDASSSEAFNRDVIKHWLYKNPDNQVQVSSLKRQSAERSVGIQRFAHMDSLNSVTNKNVFQ